MENLRPKEIAEKVKALSGINIYKNTRKREYVEYRALVCFIFRTKLNLRWMNIAKFFESKGKKMDHATAIHLVKMYPLYKQDNLQLDEIENMFIFKSGLEYDEIDKLHYLENKLSNCQEKHLKLQEELKNPLVKLMHNVPENRYNEVEERLRLLKRSWDWK
jgi:hypothetical protein